MKFISLLIISAILLSGCASYQPIPEGYEGSTAAVYDSSKNISPTKVYFFQLTKVNGRNVLTSADETFSENYGKGFFMKPVTTFRHIPVEKSILRIEGVTYRSAPILTLSGGNYHVEGEVEIDISEGDYFYVKGELSKEYSAVWIEDNHGKIVTKKIEKFAQ